MSRNVGRRMDEMELQMTEKLKQILSEQTIVCTTDDIWSSNRRHFLGVAVHWINISDFSRKSAALACLRFVGRITYNHVCGRIAD